MWREQDGLGTAEEFRLRRGEAIFEGCKAIVRDGGADPCVLRNLEIEGDADFTNAKPKFIDPDGQIERLYNNNTDSLERRGITGTTTFFREGLRRYMIEIGMVEYIETPDPRLKFTRD